jgi:uncharacterized protein (TIGR02646 family)
MRRIDRAAVAAPACLSSYTPDSCSWDDEPGKTRFGGQDKLDVRSALDVMQAGCCAYCESATYGDAHIEHFRRKNKAHFPQLMFTWGNLFLSCNALDHCGHHKDRGGRPYDPADLVKPDQHDPDDYFYFHSAGQIRVRSNIGEQDAFRAKETIRVFRLDCGALEAARRRAVEAYQRRDPGIIDALCELDEASRQAFIDDEIRATARDPHSSVIRHLFEKVR